MRSYWVNPCAFCYRNSTGVVHGRRSLWARLRGLPRRTVYVCDVHISEGVNEVCR